MRNQQRLERSSQWSNRKSREVWHYRDLRETSASQKRQWSIGLNAVLDATYCLMRTEKRHWLLPKWTSIVSMEGWGRKLDYRVEQYMWSKKYSEAILLFENILMWSIVQKLYLSSWRGMWKYEIKGDFPSKMGISRTCCILRWLRKKGEIDDVRMKTKAKLFIS